MTRGSALSRAAARTNSQRVPGSGKLGDRVGGRENPAKENGVGPGRPGVGVGGEGLGCAQRPRKGWIGRQQRRKKGSRQYSVGTGQAAGRQTEEKKGGWEGGESPGRRPAALGGHRRHGAGGPGAGCAKAEGTRGVRRGDSPWLGVGRCPTLGRAGRVSHRLPPGAQSRRVWLQDSSHRGRGSARSLARWLAGSGAQAAGPRQGGPRRPPAPPRPARDPSRDAPSVAGLASAPLAVRGQPAPPRTLREPPS